MNNRKTAGRMLVGLTALGLGAVAGLGPTACAAEPAPVSATASVTIPFAPAIGRPMRLHSETHKTRVVGTVETALEDSTSDDELVFAGRQKDGYVLRWTSKSATIHTSPERQALMDQVSSASVGRSALIQTDAHGAPLALLNPAEMRALIAAALDKAGASIDAQYAARPQGERDAIHGAVANFAGLYRTMTDAQIGDTVLKDAKMLFGYGGDALVRGRPVAFGTTMTVPVVNTPVAAAGTVTLRDADAAEMTIAVTSALDPSDTKATLARLYDTMSAGSDAAKQPMLKAIFDQLQDLAVTDEVVLTIDARTGLPRRATHRRRVDFKTQSRVETTSFAFAG